MTVICQHFTCSWENQFRDSKGSYSKFYLHSGVCI